ncbi:hypothetical protein B566_EDAN010269 [Ephemera danica]|nr:hypothetical protein B566_EDAN010269 [Ephemera danica]
MGGHKKTSPVSSGQTNKKGTSSALMAAKRKAQQQKKNNSDILIDDPYQVELGLLNRCLSLDPISADEGDIIAVHTQELLNLLKGTRESTDIEKLEQLSSDYDAVYIHPTSYDLAILAAGSATSLVEAVCKGKAQNGMALIRPPGHHAMEAEFCGYCFFNNAAVAVTRALNEGWAKRVLIVDWDVHHGQATQQAFYSDPRVLYFSIHRYEQGQFWPNLEESNFHYIGEDQGRGYNVNIPLNEIGMGDAEYLAIFQHYQPDLVLVSAGYDAAIGCPEFGPDLVLISAGYDSALGDEKGEMTVTPACYAHLTNLLSTLAGGKLAVLLEGGYCLSSLAESAAMTLRALLGDPCPSLGPLSPPCDSILTTILNAIYMLRPYWDVFKHHPVNNDKEVSIKFPFHFPKVTYLGPAEPAKKPFPTRDCYPLQSEEFKSNVEAKLNSLISGYNLMTVPTHRVGLVYHDGMLAHRNEHEPGHVESPYRASGIFAKHEEYNLVERCHRLEARRAKEEELLMIHSASHVARIQETRGKSAKDLVDLAESFNSIYLHPDTCDSAELAAGCVLEAVDAVMSGVCQSAVAIVRPPGHHAEHDTPCGFCLVLLLDWDVHHGNGTQQLFVDDPRVMYVSLHRYDNGSFFPATMSATAAAEASSEFVGSGPGKGFSINVAWNKRGMNDGDYVAAFLQVVLPIVYQFDPELVLISAGFDAAIRDPLGGLAGGRVVVALEGGYNVSSISYSLTMCTKALLGDPLPSVRAAAPCPSAVNSIRSTQRAHTPYWSCLAPYNKAIPAKDGLVKPAGYKPTPTTEDLTDLMSKLKVEESSPAAKQPLDSDQDQAGSSGSGCSYSQSQTEPGPSSSGGATGDPTDCKTLKEYLAECLKVHCGRYMNAHMQAHSEDAQHPLVLSQADLSVWCYGCDTYVDAPALYEAKNSAHRFKFGVDMPWTYDTIEMS